MSRYYISVRQRFAQKISRGLGLRALTSLILFCNCLYAFTKDAAVPALILPLYMSAVQVICSSAISFICGHIVGKMLTISAP